MYPSALLEASKISVLGGFQEEMRSRDQELEVPHTSFAEEQTVYGSIPWLRAVRQREERAL